MTDGNVLTIIDQIKPLLELGFGGVMLYFVIELWRDRKSLKKDYDEKIEKKDTHIREINKEVLNTVKENTKSNVELRGSIQSNTKSNDNLTSHIYDLLKESAK